MIYIHTYLYTVCTTVYVCMTKILRAIKFYDAVDSALILILIIAYCKPRKVVLKFQWCSSNKSKNTVKVLIRHIYLALCLVLQ